MKSEHLTEVKQILKQHQFKKLFSGDTENTFIQFFRYCFVGGFATVVDWALSSLLLFRFWLCSSLQWLVICCRIAGQLFSQYILDFQAIQNAEPLFRVSLVCGDWRCGIAIDHRHYKGICLGVGRCDKLVSDFEQGSFHSSGILLELLRQKVLAVYEERSIRIYIFQN